MKRAIAAALLVLPGCEGGSPRPPIRPVPAACPGLTATVEAVRGGDVNSMFLKAVVRDEAPEPGRLYVSFLLARTPRGNPNWTVPQGIAGPDGVAYSDLGAWVADDEAAAEAAAAARVVDVYLARPTEYRCRSHASAEFAPAVRTVVPPPAVATSRAVLRARLREFVRAARVDHDVVRLPDGSSGCRFLQAVATDLDRHPERVGSRAVLALVGAAEACLHPPGASNVVPLVRRALRSL